MFLCKKFYSVLCTDKLIWGVQKKSVHCSYILNLLGKLTALSVYHDLPCQAHMTHTHTKTSVAIVTADELFSLSKRVWVSANSKKGGGWSSPFKVDYIGLYGSSNLKSLRSVLGTCCTSIRTSQGILHYSSTLFFNNLGIPI